MAYGLHKKLAKMKPIKLDIAGEEIECVASFKYLGVWLDECMSFKEHIQLFLQR